MPMSAMGEDRAISAMCSNIGGEHAGGTHLKPRIPGDAVDAVLVETMNNLPHPLHGAADHFGDSPIRAATDGEHDHAGITAVDGIAPLSLQAAKFALFERAERAYSNSVFHGDTSRGRSRNNSPGGVLFQPAACSCAQTLLFQWLAMGKLSAENGTSCPPEDAAMQALLLGAA